MKIYKTQRIAQAVTMLVLLLTQVSCSENDDPFALKYGGTLSTTIDGTAVASNRNTIFVYEGNLRLESEFNGESIEVGVSSGIAETTYDIGETTDVFFQYDGDENYFAILGSGKRGEFVITEIDENAQTMSGTFYTTLSTADETESVTISSGTFSNVPYAIQKEKTGSESIALIDGVALKGTTAGTGGGSGGLTVKLASGYKFIDLTFPNTTVPVEYDLETLDPYYTIKFVDGLYSYGAVSGTITVTSVNTSTKSISGTFEAEVEALPLGNATKQITNGVFSFTYP